MRAPFLIVFAVLLLAKGQSAFWTLSSLDGYLMASQADQGTIPFDLYVSQGRLGWIPLIQLREFLGFHGAQASFAAVFLSLVMSVASGLIFVQAITGETRAAEAVVFGLVFSIHPFTAEIFTFNESVLYCYTSILLGSAGLLLARRAAGYGAYLGCALLIGFAVSVYQLVLNYMAAAILLAFVVRLLERKNLDARGLRTFEAELRMAAITAAGVFLYLCALAVLFRVSGATPDGRADVSGLLDVRQKVADVVRAIRFLFWPPEGLIPAGVSWLFLGVLAASLGAVSFHLLRAKRAVEILVILALVGLALLAAVGVTVVGRTVWLVPRTLSAYALFAGAVLMLGWRVSGVWARAGLALALALLTVSFIGRDNNIFYDQRRVNLWDVQQANRIVGRLEGLPGFSSVRKLAMVGGSWRRPVALSTTVGDMNVSAIGVGWTQLALTEQATGYRFMAPTPAERAEAERHCGNVASWPALEASVIRADLAIVCLEKAP